MIDELNKLKDELKLSNKIRADHAERIRILELAIEDVLDSNYFVDTDRDDLRDAIIKSHQIAIRDYS
jgi:hypothetical protein